MTKSEAKAVGSVRYDTGRTCKHGHVSLRYTVSGQCCECWRLKNERRRGRLRNRPAYVPKPRKVLSHPKVLAKAAGGLTFHGRPCTKGHGLERYVSSSACVVCAKASNKARYGKADRASRNKPVTKRRSTPEERAKRREKARKYKARKRAAGPNYTAADVVWMRERQGGKCGLCLLKVGNAAWEVDHRVSLAGGGTNDRLNLHITHLLCNRSKGKRHEIDYARERFGRLL